MLNLNPADDSNSNSSVTATTSSSNNGIPFNTPVWKVLIYDDFGRDVISPVVTVNELRENGVTVYLPLHSSRQAIPDVPAVYFISPTSSNISKISQDLSLNLYESYYINFTTPVPRPLLEELAHHAVQAQSVNSIEKVYDMYTGFTCLEKDLFTLEMEKTFEELNKAGAGREVMIETVVDKVVTGLFGVCVTMGVIPVIRCPRGNAAEMIATKLDSKLRDHVMNSRSGISLFSNENNNIGLGVQRPLLIITDRSIDLASMLCHAWNYNALVHDVLNSKLNRVVVTTEEQNRPVKKTYDINVKDFFWNKNSGSPFPQVAEQVDIELKAYKEDAQEILKSSGASSIEEMTSGNSDVPINAKNLKSALTQLPELTVRKNTIDMHMNIATALLQAIKDRSLDVLFGLEEGVGKQNKSQLLETLSNPKMGTPEDRIRLLLFYYLSIPDISNTELEEYINALKKSGVEKGFECVEFVKRTRTFNKITSISGSGSSTGGLSGMRSSTSNDFLGKFSSLGNKLTENLKDSTLSSALSSFNFTDVVKNLVSGGKELALTRTVEALMDGAEGNVNDDYLYLDPKMGRNTMNTMGGSAVRGGKKQFNEAVVFVVGGGSYVEYQNLVDWVKQSSNKKKITYGTTEMVTPVQFLSQLSELGK
ncbi:Sec1-like protein [Paraphysoderma sedebokerense]|nr:Sec1-like protein [Paraphysoderma sedebokerense]